MWQKIGLEDALKVSEWQAPWSGWRKISFYEMISTQLSERKFNKWWWTSVRIDRPLNLIMHRTGGRHRRARGYVTNSLHRCWRESIFCWCLTLELGLICCRRLVRAVNLRAPERCAWMEREESFFIININLRGTHWASHIYISSTAI